MKITNGPNLALSMGKNITLLFFLKNVEISKSFFAKYFDFVKHLTLNKKYLGEVKSIYVCDVILFKLKHNPTKVSKIIN